MRHVATKARKVTAGAMVMAAVVAAPTAAFAHGAPSVDAAAGAAAAKGADGGSGPGGLNAQDRGFLNAAGHGAAAEVATGGLAISRGVAADARAYGFTMVVQHSSEAADLRRVADRLDRSVPDRPNREQRMTLRELLATSPARFDCAYIRHEVQDHRKDVSDYQEEVAKGANRQVRAFAERWLPTLHFHLDWARQIRDRHGCR